MREGKEGGREEEVKEERFINFKYNEIGRSFSSIFRKKSCTLSHSLYFYFFQFMYIILSSCLSMSLSLHISHSLFLFVSLHSFHFVGTGHGVGAALNVHEGPHSVSRVLNPQPLVAGMVVSK